VKYWLHNEFLQVDGGKMSKSLGNVYTLRDLEEKGFSPLDLRYFYFMAQYSNPQNFTWEALTQAKSTRANLQKKIAKFQPTEAEHSQKPLPATFAELIATYPAAENFLTQIDEAMKDNFNTPKLLSVVNNTLISPTKEELAVLYRLEERILKV
jgi:cysteinyl-tRNA synthetase